MPYHEYMPKKAEIKMSEASKGLNEVSRGKGVGKVLPTKYVNLMSI